MDHDWLPLLRTVTDRFAAVLDDGDPTAPVPACPGWTLADLGEHVGGIHQWATHAIVHGTPDGSVDAAPAAGLPDWYRTRADVLHAALAERDADAPAWTFGAAPHTAAFWRRRQVHEVLVHTWDAESSQGTPSPLDPALAWDGVDEVATMFYPRQVRLGRVDPLPRALRLVATDLDADPVALGDGPAVEVRAPAAAVLLMVWHRADPASYDVAPEAAALLGRALTP